MSNSKNQSFFRDVCRTDLPTFHLFFCPAFLPDLCRTFAAHIPQAACRHPFVKFSTFFLPRICAGLLSVVCRTFSGFCRTYPHNRLVGTHLPMRAIKTGFEGLCQIAKIGSFFATFAAPSCKFFISFCAPHFCDHCSGRL